MHVRTVAIKPSTVLSVVLVGAAIFFGTTSEVRANPISPDLQARVDKAKKKLVEWAADPVVVAAV